MQVTDEEKREFDNAKTYSNEWKGDYTEEDIKYLDDYLKGLYKDSGLIDQPPGTHRDALNMVMNLDKGSVSTEISCDTKQVENRKSSDLKTEVDCNRNHAEVIKYYERLNRHCEAECIQCGWRLYPRKETK